MNSVLLLLLFAVLLLALFYQVDGDACSDVCTCYKRKGKLIVDCSYLELTAVPADLPHDTSRLRLNGNQIVTIDATSWGPNYLQDLRVLQLNNNPIVTIAPGVFHNVRHIHTLQLQFTKVQHLQAGVFNELTRLKWLWLNDCDINLVDPGAFLSLNRIWEIYMYNNPDLNALAYGIFQDNPNLKHLYLQNTDLPEVNCCNFVGLNKWLDIKWPGKLYLDQLRCPCDTGSDRIDCNSVDFPLSTIEHESCPITYTFNSANRLLLSFTHVVAASLIVSLSYFVI